MCKIDHAPLIITTRALALDLDVKTGFYYCQCKKSMYSGILWRHQPLSNPNKKLLNTVTRVSIWLSSGLPGNMEAPLPTHLYMHVLLYKHQLTIELVNSLSNPPGFIFSTDRYKMLLIHDCTWNWFSGFHMIIKSIVQMLCLDACASTLTYHVRLHVWLTCTVIALHSYVCAYTVHVRYMYMNVLPTWVYVNVLMLYSFQYMKYVGKMYILVTA